MHDVDIFTAELADRRSRRIDILSTDELEQRSSIQFRSHRPPIHDLSSRARRTLEGLYKDGAAAINFQYNEYGKPSSRIRCRRIFTYRSDRVAMIGGGTRTREWVGIEVETHRRIVRARTNRRSDSLRRSEVAVLRALPGRKRSKRSVRYWTRKGSLQLKAAGWASALEPASFEFSAHMPGECRMEQIEVRRATSRLFAGANPTTALSKPPRNDSAACTPTLSSCGRTDNRQLQFVRESDPWLGDILQSPGSSLNRFCRDQQSSV